MGTFRTHNEGASAPSPAKDPEHILSLEELQQVSENSSGPAETLMKLVALIASRLHTEVCSAYLLEPDRAHLVLAATIGLTSRSVGTIRLALHEGLVGLVAEQVRPVAVEQVKQHDVDLKQLQLMLLLLDR